MYFEAITWGRNAKRRFENLDSLIELQEFGEKMAIKGATEMIVTTYNEQGAVKQYGFHHNGSTWNKHYSYDHKTKKKVKF